MLFTISLAHALPLTPLVFEVHGLTTEKGQVLCTLYGDAKTWLSDPGYLATTSAEPVDGRATCVFEDVPAGLYAISFIHDVNGNGDMDTNLLGLPREPWGMSRNASALFGPPRFEAAAFQHPSSAPPSASPH